MENAIVIAILFIVVGGAGYYIFKKKNVGIVALILGIIVFSIAVSFLGIM